MKSGQNLITKGTTNFVTEGDSDIIGTTSYIGENTSNVPSFIFYLYHSKNLTETGNIGTVTISLVSITPIDDLNNDVERLNINVDLSKALYNTNDYEGTITPGKEYEMFATNTVNITTNSSFSTYYSLFMNSDTNPYKDGYHRALVSTYAFPINTKITMIDFAEEDKPVYYYYVVNNDDYNASLLEYNQYGEVSYKLSKFIKMGSTSSSNNYHDSEANNLYYKNGTAQEEFIFIVNFEDSNITEDVLDRKLLIELRNNEEQTLISVLGIEQDTLKYDLYANSDAVIDLEANLSKNPVYIGNSTNLTINTNFIQNKVYSNTIYDTSYNNQKLGVKISLYDENGNLVYSFNEGYSLPIIIKDTDRYGVEFNNRLLYIKSDEGEVINNTNTDKHNASGVGVFNYHAFYDENDPSDSCPTVICHSKKQFKEQLDYLKENNILTLKMKELEMYIDGKLQLPKSVLLTIDDGGRDKIAVDMLTEYKMYATIFLVTAWYDPSTYYKTDYIELHSHTNNMHNTGVCPGGQGGGIKCLSEEEIQTDLKTSREKLGGSTYIAYPFYEYNEYSIRMLKEAGFTMAFAGEWDKSDNLVHVGSDKFRLRRFVIVTYTTIKGINEYLGQIK